MVRSRHVSALGTQPFLLRLRRGPVPLREAIWVNVAAHSATSIFTRVCRSATVWRLGVRLPECSWRHSLTRPIGRNERGGGSVAQDRHGIHLEEADGVVEAG